ncbi:MAG: HEAT repeat domain-containing protein [Bryobacteraceae bacterium]
MLRSIGLRGSLASGDISALLSVQRSYSSLSSDTAGWHGLLDELRSYYSNVTPQALSVLGQIASDPTGRVDLRSAAAGALARMHTREALPFLAVLLDDPSQDLRAIASGGIASFANNLPMGSHQPATGPWPYRTPETIARATFEARHAPFWKAWWQENRTKLIQ